MVVPSRKPVRWGEACLLFRFCELLSVCIFTTRMCSVLSDEEIKRKISSWGSVMRAGLEEGQQNCGDPAVTQAVWERERGLLGFTEVHVGVQLEMRLLNFILQSVWS